MNHFCFEAAPRAKVGYQLGKSIDSLLSKEGERRSVFLFVDASVWNLWSSRIGEDTLLASIPRYEIYDPEQNKSLEGLAEMASWLIDQGATRSSLIVAWGGGAVTDSVGLLAQVYMRGVRLLLIPTTLLSMVDAAIGGKCGVNFGGMKNLIGSFADPMRTETICDTQWLESLPRDEYLSGYAELLKMGLLMGDDEWTRVCALMGEEPNARAIVSSVERAVQFKLSVVAEDYCDEGLRRQLNLGHTIGHALEAWSYKSERRPLLHGEAVAHGLVVELYLSYLHLGLSTDYLHQMIELVRNYYPRLALTCQDYPELLELMHHDKKNDTGGLISIVGLRNLGRIEEIQLEEDAIREGLDFYQDSLC